MELFGMGGGELLLILVIILLIWGPGKLPEIANKLGKLVSSFRKSSLDLTTQIKREIEAEEKESAPREKETAARPEKPREPTAGGGDDKNSEGKDS
jgi:Tat protein translocase TatB subunit